MRPLPQGWPLGSLDARALHPPLTPDGSEALVLRLQPPHLTSNVISAKEFEEAVQSATTSLSSLSGKATLQIAPHSFMSAVESQASHPSARRPSRMTIQLIPRASIAF